MPGTCRAFGLASNNRHCSTKIKTGRLDTQGNSCRASGAVAVDTDTIGIGVQWSETSNADDFSKNLIRARVEGRFATSVYSPLGVVSADLTP